MEFNMKMNKKNENKLKKLNAIASTFTTATKKNTEL